jgi:hypothetical protein
MEVNAFHDPAFEGLRQKAVSAQFLLMEALARPDRVGEPLAHIVERADHAVETFAGAIGWDTDTVRAAIKTAAKHAYAVLG